MGSSFNGRTSALHAENKGSIPFGSTTDGRCKRTTGLITPFVQAQLLGLPPGKVTELANVADCNSVVGYIPWRFESSPSHQCAVLV
jgi:hypothetical protein